MTEKWHVFAGLSSIQSDIVVLLEDTLDYLELHIDRRIA